MADSTCTECGAELSGRQRSTCSKACKIRRDRRLRAAKPGFREYKRAENARRRGVELGPRIEQYDCATCGKTCVPGENVAPHARKFCGDPHCKRAWHSPNPENFKPKGKRASRGPSTKLRWVSCRQCKAHAVVDPRVGRPLRGWTERSAGGWCCPNCPPGWPDNQTNIWTAGQCRRCGDKWVHRDSRGDAAYCSSQCAKADIKAARRVKTPDISRPRRYAIFERDGWRCQLCGGMTRKDQARLLGGKDYLPDAPTIDHIIPVSKGGTNDESNLQTAHWSCNSIKSDGTFNASGEQLRLLAA